MDNQYDLIVTVVNRGYADYVMAAAKSQGARGGTILNGRGTGAKEAEKFFNLIFQEEKELVLIVALKSIKNAIMSEIVNKTGLNSPGQGITFSLPVDAIAGLTFIQDTENTNEKED